MPRPPRLDEPGAWHHVFNRAVAKRALFLSRKDHRYFQACLAHAARSGNLETHKCVLVINHYHLLTRSPNGRLDAAMHDIQMCYARYLNRRLGRDGPLFSNRYKSKRVTSDAYHHTLVSYIDSNPVAAGLAARPEDYPWSCAKFYRARRRPRWLTTCWVDTQVKERTGRDARDTAAYRSVFPVRCDPDFQAWVERRLRSPDAARDDIDLVLGANPQATLAWMRRQAELADGEDLALPVSDAGAILSSLRAVEPQSASMNWRRRPAPGPIEDARGLLRAGLLRDAARLTWAEIARRVGDTPGTVRNRWLAHRRRLLEDAAYAEHATRVVRAASRATLGEDTAATGT
ncbi:MAG: transposase [Planctomycetota bacterium]